MTLIYFISGHLHIKLLPVSKFMCTLVPTRCDLSDKSGPLFRWTQNTMFAERKKVVSNQKVTYCRGGSLYPKEPNTFKNNCPPLIVNPFHGFEEILLTAWLIRH